jgi:hypothetical protein
MKFLNLIINKAMFFLYNFLSKGIFKRKASGQNEDEPYALTDIFIAKFLVKETGELYGQKLENFKKIFYLFFILFLAGGFGWQSYRYIRNKLNDPFVKTMEVQNVNKVDVFVKQKVKEEIHDMLEKEEMLNKYKIKSINYFEKDINFTFSSDFKTKDYYGRSIDYNSPLLKNILNVNNKISGSNFSSINDKGVILTKSLLSELKLSPDEISTVTVLPKSVSDTLRIPVVAIVNKLPSGSEFILLNKYIDHYSWSPSQVYNFEMQDTVSIGIDGKLNPDMVKQKIIEIIKRSSYNTSLDVENMFMSSINAINPGHVFKIPVKTAINDSNILFNGKSIVYLLQKELAAELNFSTANFYPAFEKFYSDLSDNSTLKGQSTNSIELTFDKLTRVYKLDKALEEWSDTVYKEIAPEGQQLVFGFELESITLRDILNIVGFLIFTFLLIITILSLVSIYTIIKVVFEKYFQKIDKNIGTFKAFGINIKEIYQKVLVIFIIISLIFSFLAAIIAGEIISLFLNITSLVTSMNESVDLFNLFNIVPVILIVFISIAVLVAYKAAFKIFDAWPGDIIYDRANKA